MPGPNRVFYRDAAKRYPLAVRGEGVWLYDADGKRYLDGSSGALVASIGHGRREVAEAASRAIGTLGFAHTSQFTSEGQERLAACLAALAPMAAPSSVYFVSGGSEANETAIKMAHQYHARRGNARKRIVVSRSPSYHGNTLGALSASGHRTRRASSAQLFDWPSVEAPECERCRYVPSCEACAQAWADAVERAIVACGPENVAAFIAESVTGSASAASVTPAPFFARIRAICDRHDVLFIADEVMCGIGRTGYDFAVEHHRVAPDVITAAKGVSGGYAPLGAVIASPGVFETFVRCATFSHGFTHGGSSIATAIGAAVMEIYEREGLRERARLRGSRLRGLLERLSAAHPIVGEVRGLGLMLGLELVADREGGQSYPPQAEVTKRVVSAAFERGLIVYPAGVGASRRHRDQVLIGPPLIIEERELDRLVELLDAALADVERALVSSRRAPH